MITSCEHLPGRRSRSAAIAAPDTGQGGRGKRNFADPRNEIDGPGDCGSDGLTRLWAPHRMAYVNGAESRHEQPVTSCPLCDVPERNDEEALILCRGRHAYVVLNRYPYNNGHLMVVPFRHLADYAELTARESLEMCRLTRQAVKVLRTLIGAQGFNIGMNLGETGGAGIADHLHQHVVPRWQSDTNFMPVLGRTAVLPQLLEETWATLAQGWA